MKIFPVLGATFNSLVQMNAQEIKTVVGADGKSYKVCADTFYSEQTPNELVGLLAVLHKMGTPIRVYYGDRETGQDWNEENDVSGVLGRSTGQIKIPLLLSDTSATGGGGLIDSSIVALLTHEKTPRLLWKHPTYNARPLTVGPSGYADRPYGVFRNGENMANFKTEVARTKYINRLTMPFA